MNPLAGHRGLLLQELRQKGLRRRLPLFLVVGEVVLLGVPQGHHPLVFVEVRLALATGPVALEADDAKQLLRRLVRDLQPTRLEGSGDLKIWKKGEKGEVARSAGSNAV